MEIKTTVSAEQATALSGSIGRVWGVDGVTEIRNSDEGRVTIASIKTKETAYSRSRIRALTVQHERGHVGNAQDVVDALGHTDAAFTTLTQGDRWNNEVTAWIRALETPIGTNSCGNLEAFHFILDCLNSYRRSLGTPKEEWDGMLTLLTQFYEGNPDDIYDYTPLEPEAGESPTNCMPGVLSDLPPVPGTPGGEKGGGKPPEPGDEPDDDESDDEDEPDDGESEDDEESEDEPEDEDDSKPNPKTDGDESEDDDESDDEDEWDDEVEDEDPDDDWDDPGDIPESEEEIELTENDDRDDEDGQRVRGDTSEDRERFDDRWLNQDVIDDLNDGKSLQDIAAERGLDLSRVPPLIAAMGL